MPHPTESDLALYAGNDLGRMARLRVDWHLRTCGKCQQEITDFSSLRAEILRNAPQPNVNWDRLAAEMKANIRLGLEAGECVAGAQSRHRTPSAWAWAALATASLIAIAAGGELWLHHPWAPETSRELYIAAAGPEPSGDMVLQVKDNGIQMRDGEAVVSEMRNNNRGDVVYSVNTQGGVGASYVDEKTGMVTVNNISYGQ